ncbi:MAG TPA: VIT1/CCC1 transporter family protein, partial [Caulobacteraceae bacterium]|nr:VIT1/CCC1 transporter family protein [Caulobacteraceae bacterium]
PDEELAELTGIYVQRGLSADLARQVAKEMHARGALEAHARDELGMSEHVTARPIQAALTSAATFASGAVLPLAAALLAPAGAMVIVITAVSLLSLALLGAVGARTGASPMGKAVVRVTFWGALAMAATAGLGRLFGAPL